MPLQSQVFCSTVIPTVARDSLDKAVESVLGQKFEPQRHEIIVVNDSGRPLPARPWHDDSRVRILSTPQRERCVARNAGAALATGDYLHFLDDDDHVYPFFLATLHELSNTHPEAVWLYGGTQLVDRAGTPLIKLAHQLQGNCSLPIVAGEWIPLQSSLIKSDTFFAAGGFPPAMIAGQDVDLCRRISLIGPINGTAVIVASVAMGQGPASTTQSNLRDGYCRKARELILDEPGAFHRLRTSANGAFWSGRLVRVYFTSAVWNIIHRRFTRALSRTLFGTFALTNALPDLFQHDFWSSVLKPYSSPTFERGLAKRMNEADNSNH